LLGVEQWAEIRRMRHVEGLSQREIHRRTGIHRDTIRRALASSVPPSYGPRPPRASKLDPFVGTIEELLADEPTLSGVRVREELERLGYRGGKTILDDPLRALRPRFLPPRSFQRTRYRPGELAQFDLCQRTWTGWAIFTTTSTPSPSDPPDTIASARREQHLASPERPRHHPAAAVSLPAIYPGGGGYRRRALRPHNNPTECRWRTDARRLPCDRVEQGPPKAAARRPPPQVQVSGWPTRAEHQSSKPPARAAERNTRGRRSLRPHREAIAELAAGKPEHYVEAIRHSVHRLRGTPRAPQYVSPLPISRCAGPDGPTLEGGLAVW
jgi:transcriptional regulator with XRE-family HTH domain